MGWNFATHPLIVSLNISWYSAWTFLHTLTRWQSVSLVFFSSASESKIHKSALFCSVTQFCRFTKHKQGPSCLEATEDDESVWSWILWNGSFPTAINIDAIADSYFWRFWWTLSSAYTAVRRRTDGGLVKANLQKQNSSISLQHLSFGPCTQRDTCSQE